MIVILFFQDVRFIFYNFLGDGIYDRLDNDKILHKIWSYKKAGQKFDNIHELCAKITDAIIKYSMEKNSVDNPQNSLNLRQLKSPPLKFPKKNARY